MENKTKLLSEIIMLAMKIQEETDYCVFVRTSGHVGNLVEIKIAASKKSYNNKIVSCEFHPERDSSTRMEQVKETLINFLEEGIDQSELDYWVEEVRHYTF